MEDQTPLNGRLEWAEGDSQPGNKFEKKDGADSAGKKRGPSGLRTFYGIGIQLRLSLKETEPT